MESIHSHSNKAEDFQLYADAFSFIPGYLYILDKDGKLVNCNNNLLKKLGIDNLQDHEVGAIYRLMQEQGFGNEYQLVQHKKADIQSLMSEKPHHSEQPIPLWLDQKETRWFKVGRMPLRDPQGQIEGLLVTLTDITDQEHLQEQLSKLKKELQRNNQHAGESFNFNTDDFASDTPPRVLLIEDNFLAQKAAKSVLMSCDCVVDVVSNEKELKSLFVPGHYQLVLMDIGLEGSSGYMLAKELRRLEQGSKHRVPIIALTGFDAEVVQADCEHYHMEGAIHKPLTVEQARQIIQHYIKHIDVEVSGLFHGK
ncbi:MAG: response regulator [Legionellaceae bacterium]|nr:response regulator [Legionellaceae bacterium]